MSTRVQAVGECMLEIARTEDGVALGYAGDTYNTAVYASRVAGELGVELDVRFLTGVGVDDESRRMRDRWRQLGVGDDAIAVPGATPGIYLITTDDEGERTFTYWRSQSAASRLFTRVDWMEQLGADYLYLSGVTLQLMPLPVRIALIDRLRTLRGQGTKVVFDSNYRPSGWPDVTAASAAMASVLRVCDLALVTLEDEIALGSCHDASSCAAHLAALGVPEIVVKLGADGALVRTATDGLIHVQTTPRVAVDTTGAGDSFNGAYLVARLGGYPAMEAAHLANRLAGDVVTRRGAIVDTEPLTPPGQEVSAGLRRLSRG